MKRRILRFLPVVVLLFPVASHLVSRHRSGAPTEVESGTVVAASRAESREARQFRARITKARRLLEQHPESSSTSVTLAVEDERDSKIHLLNLPKENFLERDAEVELATTLGEPVRLKIVRPNYVNTAVEVTSADGRELTPLVVEYPIERNGRVEETAYYTSVHPAVQSDALSADGRAYIRNMLDAAAARLASHGKKISPEIVNIAERLCVVEHADHKRFKTEDRAALFNEISTLYAVNADDTYRYSVSTAGAGGMVQMIPPTYHAMRERYPEVKLRPDFVEGMRDHSNALQVMLLYMQDTWRDLAREEEIKAALDSKLATQAELLAAGYNSNPLKLGRYLERGGSNWRTLIPQETQMYLRIYAAVDELVPSHARP
ncbi:MAG TPA: hypothetical protein VER08_09470 [Pyrinomonadaceae bacterium]|nr:hypothetical protein [Pyrinomonadaceae bacterium]